MLNENIKRYINEKLSTGYSQDTIKNALLKWGYNRDDVNETFSKFDSSGRNITDSGVRRKNFFGFFTNYIHSFDDSANFNLGGAFRYFFYAYVVFFLVQILVTLGSYFFKKTKDPLTILILTNISLSTFFLAFVLVIAAFLSGLYFILFNYFFKFQMKFSMIFAALLLSLVPYLAVCSLKGTLIYNIITLAGASFGVMDINGWFLASLLIFSFGMAKEAGLSFRRCNIYVFSVFFVFLAAVLVMFSSAVKLNVLWRAFQRF